LRGARLARFRGASASACSGASPARAPKLLLLDEPLISLDPAHQRSVVETARRLRDELKIAIVFSAHELNPLIHAIDRVLLISAPARRCSAPSTK